MAMEVPADCVDVDPSWYPGQPETAGKSGSSGHVPSVLSKLQKWGDYASFGEPVLPSRFIPMKTPLSTEILQSWSLEEPPRHNLNLPDMLKYQSSQGRTVGLIIDLSNHDCLYSSDLELQEGLLYEHINLVAKELPPLEYVHRVAAVATAFWQTNPDAYIAIHCAYGFNRTGFVVCSYLIHEYGLSVDAAMQSFATSRPPGVKHDKFKVELIRRYQPVLVDPTEPDDESSSENSSLSPSGSQPDPDAEADAQEVSSALQAPRGASCSSNPAACGDKLHASPSAAASGAACGADAASTADGADIVDGLPAFIADDESLGFNERVILASLIRRARSTGPDRPPLLAATSSGRASGHRSVKDLVWAPEVAATTAAAPAADTVMQEVAAARS